MEIVVKYGSTLHIRYPSPTTSTTTDNDSNNNDNNKAGKMDVVIQRPILYSAYASLIKKYDNDEKKMTRQHQQQVNYIFCSTLDNYDDTTSRHRLDKEKAVAESMTTTTFPDDYSSHIIITVAAGMDEHYWFVTIVSMTFAFIGGLLVLVSLDSISVW